MRVSLRPSVRRGILTLVSNDSERRLGWLVAFRYIPHHMEGVVAVLLFLIALVLGAALATIFRALPSGI